MQSACCSCGCGSEPERNARGEYLVFAPGHNGGGFDAKAFQADKLARMNVQRAQTADINRAAQLASEAQRRQAQVAAPAIASPPRPLRIVVAEPTPSKDKSIRDLLK